MKIKLKLSDKTKEELKGLQGIKGDKGDKGDQGPKGLDGKKGDKGDKGVDGTDAKLPKIIDIGKINKPVEIANPYNDKKVLDALKKIEEKDLSVVVNTDKIDVTKIEKTLEEIRDKPTLSSGGGGRSSRDRVHIIDSNNEIVDVFGADPVGLKDDKGILINPATSDKQLPDGHNVNVSNQITGFATSAKQLPDNHQVTVSNPTANPETGLAKEVTLQSIEGAVAEMLDSVNQSSARQIDWASTTVLYSGWAYPGTATSDAYWRIRRRTFTGDNFADEWADGDPSYDNVWDDHLTLTYS